MKSTDLIVARPHFRKSGHDLRFFLSSRMFYSMNASEAAVWDRLQAGPLSANELGSTDAAESLARAGVVEVIEQVEDSNRQRILVVEPHCDDAALSIGSTMWKMRKDAEFHVLTLASRSNYTSAFQMHRSYFDRMQVSRMRDAEGELFVKHLGGQYHRADLPEATLRYSDTDWDLGFFDDHKIAVANFNNRRAAPFVLEAWVRRLKDFLSGRSFEEMWLPLGAGTHSDHDLGRNASLQALMELRPNAVIRLYEDVPYGGEFPQHSERILQQLRNAGAVLSPWTQDVTESFAKKLSLLGIFASQFKVSSIGASVERNAGGDFGHQRTERLWTLDLLPRAVDRDKMWFGAPEIEKVGRKLSQFRRGSERTRRIAIFAINAAGRWADDVDWLRALFPRAKFIVYAEARVIADFSSAKSSHVVLRRVNGSAIAWAAAAIREMGTSHRIVIAGQALEKAKMLAGLWFKGRKIIVSQMDHLSQAFAAE